MESVVELEFSKYSSVVRVSLVEGLLFFFKHRKTCYTCASLCTEILVDIISRYATEWKLDHSQISNAPSLALSDNLNSDSANDTTILTPFRAKRNKFFKNDRYEGDFGDDEGVSPPFRQYMYWSIYSTPASPGVVG